MKKLYSRGTGSTLTSSDFPVPLVKAVDDLIDVSLAAERVPLARELKGIVLNEIALSRTRFSDDPDILSACDALEAVAAAEVPLETLCKTRSALYRLLHEESRRKVRTPIRRTGVALGKELERMRDPNRIELPERIITCGMRWCPEAPWYALRYSHDDPEHAGTTGGPHVILVRTPERIDVDGQDLPSDYFLTTGLLDDPELLARIHSECWFGDILEQMRCDCGPQLKQSMRAINERGKGLILYLRQEGRGMGLFDKMDALELAEGRVQGRWVGKKHDTESAMMAQGYESAELRKYGFIGPWLHGLGIRRVKLMSHNPVKEDTVRGFGIDVTREEAAGEVGGHENLVEFLWKIVEQRYRNITLGTLRVELDHHLDELARGIVTDPILCRYLLCLLQMIERGNALHVNEELQTVILANAVVIRNAALTANSGS